MKESQSNDEENGKLGLTDPAFNFDQYARTLIDEATKKASEQFDIQRWFKDNPVSSAGHKVILEFENKSTNKNPIYETEGAAGFDLRANLEDDVIIEPREWAIVPTGLFFKIPEGFEIQIRPRSGLAAKKGVTVLNSPGTIDWDYRGEIKIILINHGREAFIIKHGERIAQGVMAAVTAKQVVELKEISEVSKDTERGDGGFGSTGKE